MKKLWLGSGWLTLIIIDNLRSFRKLYMQIQGTLITKGDTEEYIILYRVSGRVSLSDGSRSSGRFTKNDVRR